MTDTLVERLEGKRPFRGTELRECFARIKAQASRIAELEEALERIAAETFADWTIPRDIARKALEDQTLSNGEGE